MSANTAVALADGAVDDATRRTWEPHLAGCGVCRQMVAALLGTLGAESGPPLERAAGDVVGRYELVERLGAGGFGVVFRARDPELGRDVALKLWRFAGSDPVLADGARERLLGEARALAQLAHPNVMAVFDSGRSGDEVFLAGELVAGKSFGARIAEGMPPAEAVDVALQAARGLAAAHAARIVHRDVKPDNILCGDDGRVRVVDFGLARPTASDDAGPTAPLDVPRLRQTITLTGSIVGTPAYMAPEQFLGASADAASDQFSLCASLFEALTGERPIPGDDFDALRAAALAGERRPMPPGVPAWLGRILERGLQQEPARRFPSMQALIAELERDRGRSRRRIAWASSVAAACAAVTFFTWPTPAAGIDCDTAAAKLEGVWDDDRREAVRVRFAEVARGRLGGEAFERVAAALDDYAAAWVAMHADSCEATHVRGEQSPELLDRRVACLERRRRELDGLVDLFAEADAALLERAPRAITQLAPLSQCADLEALSVLAPRPGDPERRRAVEEVEAELAAIEALRMAGVYEEATERAAALAERAAEIGYAPLAAETAFELGFLWSYRSEAEHAQRWLEDAHHQAIAARSWRIAARAAIELVLVHGELAHDHVRAREWGRHAASALAAAGGDDNLQSNLDNNLGGAALDAADHDVALEYHQRALARREATFGPRDRSVAQSLNNLGLVLQSRGDYAGAVEHFARAHDIFGEALGAHHPYVGLTAQNLGNLRLALGDTAAAEALFRQAYDIAVDAQGPDSAAALDARFNLATALDEHGADEPRAILEEVLAARRQHFPGDLEAIARVVNSLGVVAEQAGRLGEARPHFEEALALRRQIHGDEHPDALFVALNLALVCSRQGDGERARELLGEVVPGFERALGADHPLLGVALTVRGQQHLTDGAAGAALADLDRALAVYDAAGEVDPEWRADTVYQRGRALWALGRRAQATAAVGDALARYRELGVRGERAAAEAAAWLEEHGR